MESKLKKLTRLIEKQEDRLATWQQYRLSLGLSLFAFLVSSQILKGYFLELIALFLILPSFIALVVKTRAIHKHLSQLKDLNTFYQKQKDMKLGLFQESTLPTDMAESDLARDLDLGVLYFSLNHCISSEGESLLNHWLCQKFGNSKREDRLQKLKDLLQWPSLLRRLQALSPSENKVRLKNLGKELQRPFFPENRPWKWVLPLSWLLLISTLLFSWPLAIAKVSLFIYVASLLLYLGQTKDIFLRLQDLQLDFERLSEKLSLFEKISQGLTWAPSLKAKQATQGMKGFATLIALMSLRTNPILFYILNMIVPWDFIVAELSESQRKKVSQHFKLWSEELILIDVLSCFANLKIYHDTEWPELLDKNNWFLEFKDLSHPLLNQDQVVTNSFHPHKNRIIILTGSNMSGKSTFLRAVGINLALANIGAPVFAKHFAFRPTALMSCIRVSDSLRDGQSYFYAEVRRLRSILERAQNEDVIFLIDEPLRGTNNKERLIGNTHYLKSLLKTQGYGFLSTHDLELTQLSQVSPEVCNFHFSEAWQGGGLRFDYKIKEGPSQSTNALRILAQEGLYPPQEI